MLETALVSLFSARENHEGGEVFILHSFGLVFLFFSFFQFREEIRQM